MKLKIFLYLVLLHTSPLWAAERYEFYNGVRMLGMGGAGIATVNDETALLVNPAGLGRLPNYIFTIADPEAAVSEEAEAIAGSGVGRATDPQFMLTKAKLSPNKHLHARGQIFPSIVFRNFGIGLFGRTEVNSELVSATNLYKYHYTNDWSGVAGFNFRLFHGIVKLGASGRVINRATIRRDDIDPLSVGLKVKTLAAEGAGVGGDGGIIITAPIAWLPAVAAVYRDIGRTSYALRDGMFYTTTVRPDSTPESLDVALAISPILAKHIRSVWTVEYRDVLTASKETKQIRRAHGGVEFNIADTMFVRGGANQGYWTAGLEFAMGIYQFQVAAYGEEIGTVLVPREDRRYVAKLAIRF